MRLSATGILTAFSFHLPANEHPVARPLHPAYVSHKRAQPACYRNHEFKTQNNQYQKQFYLEHDTNDDDDNDELVNSISFTLLI